jgi:hypothetical protein
VDRAALDPAQFIQASPQRGKLKLASLVLERNKRIVRRRLG